MIRMHWPLEPNLLTSGASWRQETRISIGTNTGSTSVHSYESTSNAAFRMRRYFITSSISRTGRRNLRDRPMLCVGRRSGPKGWLDVWITGPFLEPCLQRLWP